MLTEYDILQDIIILYCYNMSAINISKNPVQHSKTKHIEIKHRFIRELVDTKVISLEHGWSSIKLADILTKPLDVSLFENLRVGLEVCRLSA